MGKKDNCAIFELYGLNVSPLLSPGFAVYFLVVWGAVLMNCISSLGGRYSTVSRAKASLVCRRIT